MPIEEKEIFMKKFLSAAIILLMILFGQTVYAADGETSLQSLINQTKPGDVLELPPGEYVGGATIDQPIHIKGEKDVSILSDGKGPALTIQTDQAVIENMTFIDQRTPTDETVYINGRNNELKDLTIQTNGVGIQLYEAQNNTLENINITGNQAVTFAERGNGIDLWDSNNNTIQYSNISNVQDGIYLEKSEENAIFNNEVTNSRYGYHLMFTTGTNIQHNYSYFNVSGMMIMGTEGTNVENNHLQYNQKSIQSIGLLLFDVKKAYVAHNTITNNKIGLFVENSTNNEITLNKLKDNYVGTQFLKSTENNMYQNALLANVVQGQAERSSNNKTNENYWGDHTRLDTNGDGFSNLSYTVDPFYLTLTKEYPPYQIFFQAPGMHFLEQLFNAPTDQWLTDDKPLMVNPLESVTNEQTYSLYVLCFSLFLLFVSTTIIWMGVKKQ